MPLPLTEYPDAEAVAIDYLTPHLPDGFGISTRGGSGRFVRVRRIGGIELTPNHDAPQLDVLVWHDTEKLQMALAHTLWAALRAANNDVVAGKGVISYMSTTLGPRQMPDPGDDQKVVAMFTVSAIVRSLLPDVED